MQGKSTSCLCSGVFPVTGLWGMRSRGAGGLASPGFSKTHFVKRNIRIRVERELALPQSAVGELCLRWVSERVGGCVTLVMGFAKYGSRRGGVGRYTRCGLSVMRAGCNEGKRDAMRGPVHCGASMRRVVVGLLPGHRVSAPCRRCVRIWFSVASIRLVEYLRGCAGMLEFAGDGAWGLGGMACSGS